MNNKSAIFFTYASAVDLDYSAGKAIPDLFDEVIVAFGGVGDHAVELPEFGSDMIRLLPEKEKLGKSQAYNGAISKTTGKIVFLISGDVRFENSVIGRMSKCLGDDSDLAIPRVIPFPGRTLSEKIAEVMWKFHDTFTAFREANGKFFCGGEFQLIKSPLVISGEKIVNDDEYLCLRTHQQGKRIRYCRDIVIHNFMPSTVSELFRQRVRVNFGHFQLKSMSDKHSSFSKGLLNVAESVKVITRFNAEYPRNMILLMLASLIEMYSVILALIKSRTRADLSNW